MNAVEIEEAVSRLAEQPFDAAAFSFAFLEAFFDLYTKMAGAPTSSSAQRMKKPKKKP